MKQFYLVCLLALFSTKMANAQLVEVIPYIGLSQSLLVDGDTMYIGAYNQIRKFNLTDDPPVLENIHSGITLANSLLLHENSLFVSHGAPIYRILKIDIENPSLPPVYITDYSISPEVFLLLGNYLYCSNYYNNTIFRIDITNPSDTPQIILSGVTKNRAMAVKGNYIYLAQYLASGKLYKWDYTNPSSQPIELASGLQLPYDIEFKGNDLYISLSNGNKIVKADVTQSLPLTFVDVVDVIKPLDMVFKDDDLYVIDGINSNHLSKVDTVSLGVADVEAAKNITLYPNPTNDLLYLKNLKNDLPYKIYDMTSRLLQQGILSPNKSTDVSNLAVGRYFLRVDNGAVLDFIKN